MPRLCRGKHLRALLKAFRQGTCTSVEGSVHARPSDISSRHTHVGRVHSVASVSSFDDNASTRGSFREVEELAPDPALAAAAAAAVASYGPAARRGSGRRLDRSQLSLLSHNALSAPPGAVPAPAKHSWSDMQCPEPLQLARSAGGELGEMPSGLPLNLSLQDVPPAPMCGLWSLTGAAPAPPGSSAASHGESGSVIVHADTDSAASLDASGSVIIHEDHDQVSLNPVSTGGSSLPDLMRLESAPSLSARSPLSQLAAHATPQAPRGDGGAGPVGEGAEGGPGKGERDGGGEGVSWAPGSKKTSSVRFRTQPRGTLHRHKSSNYSHLLDVRVDDWCAAAPVSGGARAVQRAQLQIAVRAPRAERSRRAGCRSRTR